MKILFLCQNIVEANAWYRSSGIAKNLMDKSGFKITILNWQELKIDWSIIMQYDVVLLQRPFTKEALSLCLYIKNCGVKLWVDHDDNLLDINPENKVYPFYNKIETKRCIKNIMAVADAVSVTNGYLKEAFRAYNNNIHIIPNAFNEAIDRPKLKKRENVVFWRGSDSHIYNLLSYGQAINKVVNEFPKWKFNFMGFYPWMLSSKTGFIEGVDIVVYFRTIFNLAPTAFHVPLFNDNFNICRSNIAFIEASYAGAISIIPISWEKEYNLPALYYTDTESYYEALRVCCSGEVDVQKLNKIAWEFVLDNLTLDKINEKRINLLNNL